MVDVIIYDALSGAKTERYFTTSEIADIEARQPTANDLINQQIAALRGTITEDIRDRALLGDTVDLKAIYDKISALENQKT